MTRKFVLDMGLFEPRCGSVDWSELILWDLLRLLCYANRRVLECGRIPPLYQSGVRYIPETDEELFKGIPAVLEAGGGDCEDLAAWRVAELRHAGEGTQPVRVDARENFAVKKMIRPNGSLLYHIQVQRLVFDGREWQKGPVEDPSRILGMGAAEERSALARLRTSVGRRL